MCGQFALIGLSALGTIASISSNNSQAKAQAKQYNQQAQNERDAGILRQDDRKRDRARALGAAAASYAASGVDLTGTPQDVLGVQTREYSYDDFNDRFNINNNINSFNQSAKTVVKNAGSKNLGTLLNFGTKVASMGSTPGASSGGTGPDVVSGSNVIGGTGFQGIY